MLFSVRLEIVKVWLFSSKFIFRVALELVLQLQEMNGSKMKSWIKLFFLLLFKWSCCILATFFHVSFDLVHVDLGVQQGGEVSWAGLSGFGHLQVVQIQPEVWVAHCAKGFTARRQSSTFILQQVYWGRDKSRSTRIISDYKPVSFQWPLLVSEVVNNCKHGTQRGLIMHALARSVGLCRE